MPIAQMKELRLRKANHLAQNFTTHKGLGRDSLSFLSLSPSLYHKGARPYAHSCTLPRGSGFSLRRLMKNSSFT